MDTKLLTQQLHLINSYMNVNMKGQIGLVSVIKDLTIKGYEIFLPQHDFSAVDLIAMNSEGKIARIQVKYRKVKQNRIPVPLQSVVNGKRITIDRGMIDGWAVYCPELDNVTYLPVDISNEYKSEIGIMIKDKDHKLYYENLLYPITLF